MRAIPLILVLLAAWCGAHATPRKVARKVPVARLKATPLSPEKLRGQIAYVQNGDLWVIHSDSRQKHLLFSHDVTTRIPNRAPKLTYLADNFAFSPDLKNLVVNVQNNGSDEVVSDNDRRNPRSNGSVLYVFPLDGTAPRPLTGNEFTHKYQPRWSPDGKHIAFTQSETLPGEDIENVHVVDADGTDDHRIVGASGSGDSETSRASNPFWSTDSQSLMFTFTPPTPIHGWQNGVYSYDIGPVTMEAAIDGSHQQPFNGYWSFFDRPDFARDAGLHAQIAVNPSRTGNYIEWSNVWNKPTNDSPDLRNHPVFVLFNPICPDTNAKRVAFNACLYSATLNAQGFVQARSSTVDIFIATQKNALEKEQVRLLVAKAELLDWL